MVLEIRERDGKGHGEIARVAWQLEAKAVRSAGSKGDSYDNATTKSLNSRYKRELIDRGKEWKDVHDVMIATVDWVH